MRPLPTTVPPASSSPSGDGSSSPSSNNGHKFQPFLTSGQELARQRMLAFCYHTTLSDGSMLLVAPVTGGWLKDMADILTDAFADSEPGMACSCAVALSWCLMLLQLLTTDDLCLAL